MNFFNELKRRNVFRVAAAYVIVGWLILQVGETLAPALRLPEWINSALAFFLILGFPLALFFAWAFELTPEGIKRESEIELGESISRLSGRRLDFVIIGALVLAVVYFAFDKFVLGPERERAAQEQAIQANAGAAPATPAPDDHSIAVLPFVDMSPAGDNGYFSDGLTEELLNILAKVRELRVAGRTSSFAFKGRDEDLRGIGAKLNVKSVLEGSVRKDDQRQRVRITAQLINAEDGYHLWSETYDRNLDDIFAIQEEIAHQVVAALRVTLLGEEPRLPAVPNTAVNAYDLYLHGLESLNEASFAALERAATLFQQAIALDPAYVPAKLGLVRAWYRLASTGAIPQHEALDRGLPILAPILDADPDSADARVLRALLLTFRDDTKAAAREFTAALESEPRNPLALLEYGRFLFLEEKVEEGLRLIEEAARIEPYSVRIQWIICQTNAQMQRLEPALEACARVSEISPKSVSGPYGSALAWGYSGHIAKMAQGYVQAIEIDPDDFELMAGMAQFWLAMGDPLQAQSWLQRAEAIGAGQTVPALSRIMYHLYQDQGDLAYELARAALEREMEDRYGSQFMFRNTFVNLSMFRGDARGALDAFRDVYPWIFEAGREMPPDSNPDVRDLITIAAILQHGDPHSEQAVDLLNLAERQLGKTSPVRFPWRSLLNRAFLAAARGNRQQALDLLFETVERTNWSYDWRTVLEFNFVFARLHEEPRYQQLADLLAQKSAAQREEAYGLLGLRE